MLPDASDRRALRLVLVTANFENNSLGRTYCLWLLARHLGWDVVVVGEKGRSLWAPLADTPFAADCVLPGDRTESYILPLVYGADVVIAVKPLPSSLGLALRVTAGRTPVIADIDDPDLEVRLDWAPASRRAIDALRDPKRAVELRRLRRIAPTLPVLVSNPTLQAWYGGDVVPHVRSVEQQPEYSSSTTPVRAIRGLATRPQGPRSPARRSGRPRRPRLHARSDRTGARRREAVGALARHDDDG